MCCLIIELDILGNEVVYERVDAFFGDVSLEHRPLNLISGAKTVIFIETSLLLSLRASILKQLKLYASYWVFFWEVFPLGSLGNR